VTSGELRRLGTADAVVLGLAAMLGTGVFAVWPAAAAAAGPWLLLAVVLAALVAACNAGSAADLAVAHPESGGGYVYGYERVSPAVGRLAGVAFLVGKIASARPRAGVFGGYVLPSQPLSADSPAVVVVSVLNSAGVRWTARGAYTLSRHAGGAAGGGRRRAGRRPEAWRRLVVGPARDRGPRVLTAAG
jgi:APA family basic amino acid/polyamine antiporter